MFSEAPIKQNSFKTAFERCCRRLVEFDVSGETIPDASRGAATANALSPNFLRVRGRNRLPLSADRDEARDGRSATGLIRSAMYCGACPTSALWTSRHSLKSILSPIGSQCNSSNAGVTWLHSRRLRTIRAAAWRTRCNGLSVVCGRPTRIALQ